MTDASSQRMRDAGAHPPKPRDDGARETARDAAPVSLTLEGTREVPVIRLAEPVAPAAAAEAILARAEALTAQDMQVLRIGPLSTIQTFSATGLGVSSGG